jgi:hypothetical protein
MDKHVVTKFWHKVEQRLRKQVRTGFMCMTDFDCELGNASGGTRVYPSLANLRQNSKCCKPNGCCGIVQVTVTLKKVYRKDRT